MALDEALMRRAVHTGVPILRIYSWSTPTLSFGRNQSAIGRYDPERITARGIGVVRRPTGGRAILHHREVTYSVTAPVDALGSARESYARINRLLLYGLERLGVAARVETGVGRAPRPTDAPCFEVPVAGELSVGGRKLAGSAQWRDGGGLLQHGSILVEDDQTAIADLMTSSPGPSPPPATLGAALGWAPTAGQVAEAMFDAVRALEDDSAQPAGPDDELAHVVLDTLDDYLDDHWTWRR